MQKKQLKRTISLLLLVGIVYACMDEDRLRDMLNPEDQAAITEAQTWYESWKGTEAIELRSSSTNGGKKVKPMWENAFTKQNKGYKTVEVLLAAEKGYGFVAPDCYAKYEETGDNRYLHSRTCLVVQTNKKTGQTEGFVMTLSPDLAYLEHSKFNPFLKNNYLERDGIFSGFVVYHDTNGNFVNAWRYDNGIAYALSPGDENSGLELRNGGCTNYYSMSITETCYYTSHPGGEDTLSGCFVTVDSFDTWSICTYSGGSGGYGGGGGGSGTSPSTSATAIINQFNMNNEGINRLNAKLEEMLLKCGYIYIYNYLNNNNYHFSKVELDPTLTVPGIYNTTTKELKFKDVNSINDAFPEEFLHLYQDAYYNGIAQYAAYANIEFEAKVMQDVICMNSIGVCPKIGATQTNGNHYTKWILKITYDGTWFPNYWELFETDSVCGFKNYWDFLNDFSQDTIRFQYTLPVDRTFYPYALDNLNHNISPQFDCN